MWHNVSVYIYFHIEELHAKQQSKHKVAKNLCDFAKTLAPLREINLSFFNRRTHYGTALAARPFVFIAIKPFHNGR